VQFYLKVFNPDGYKTVTKWQRKNCFLPIVNKMDFES
jgi:hypothetical protein